MAAGHYVEMKQRGEKFVVLTAYDAPTARIEVEAGVDIVMVGDSVGTNVLGYASEREVTLGDMTHHIAAVRRGAPGVYLIGDLPFATYETEAQALESAARLAQAGADCVKFEGARPEILRALKREGHDVCCHIGLESQHQEGKRRQGKTAAAAAKLLADALELDAAGLDFLVLELIPRELAAKISERLRAPTIGIGAGADCDAQVLVVHDLAALGTRDFKHNRRYALLGAALREAVAAYARDVREGRFPAEENGFSLEAAELAAFEKTIA
ncbi:3-methyl-2-oxobutanoate hydroxymethyltransferase [Methylosinus sp. H3A]|uniref:3-methyl-2-oxobutanoate hydroxymethyltransferase n=1 Tax=Methylosinus sp. H3A TaxID=2785786 RepID=UPI0018C2CC08|nr:3-methyl-2-oxobutanoate hydroxymethyltransferase [Methylosinus sp. H3A]MBG0808904.1 3-methyl-2-oxobutanoate hydroxymethyltransferase [Methylosinus sp. H3A]